MPTGKKQMLERVKQDNRTLRFASPELKVDRKVVLAAISQNGLHSSMLQPH
ncbi:MAG: hypothetical protein CMF46_02390 [Legionellales bacterium]|nr:hypothetical protein [Legionellales bacterium]|tara:strand:+ start:637 stop:789 length:153 start_codon:yes stop_codon:yes gene_type:complete